MKASNSSIQAFKQCRRMYQLKYLYGLEPVQTAESLARGTQYHELVEELLNGNQVSNPVEFTEPKIQAMATAFQKYVMPQIEEAAATEEWFNYKTKSGHLIVGRIDGRLKSGEVIEHKTTSGLIDGSYFQKLEFDEQIPTYMVACHTNKIYYTVCAVPTIRQKKSESDSEFYFRCVEWFAEDTESKIQVVKIDKTQEELERFLLEQDEIVSEMERCSNFYRNPNNCMRWGRMCEYAPVCMNYNPNEEYIEFKRREDLYEKAGKAEV